jgi:hypothetical protein
MNNECQLGLRHVHFRAQVTQFFATDAGFLAHDSERNDAVQSLMFGMVVAHFDSRWRERPALALLARGKPWLAIRQRSYAASKWSQLER